jgi:pyruvate,water dikinase
LREIGNSKLEIRHSKLQAFLAEHGHRSFSLDIAAPTFAEDPAQIERLIQNAKPVNSMQYSVFSVQLSGVRRWVFDFVLPLTREYVRLREDQRYYWQKSLAIARQLYLLLAERLVAQGMIAERDAIFYATHDELERYFGDELPKTDLTRMISTRQAEWRDYQREFEESPTASYPAFLRGDAPTAKAVTTNAREWRGRALSPGIARGVARIVRSANELSRVQPGEILVAPATDPGWTPVFARIAGLVVERGGVLSHSAVVAREYRVPGVAGIAGIVDAIRDGEMIEVDGNAGMVKRV